MVPKMVYRCDWWILVMGRLDNISLEELQERREQTEGEIPRERVLAAIVLRESY